MTRTRTRGARMKPMNRMISATLLTVLMLPIASPAQAYLDPGTGSMILQILLGGIAGLLVAGKLYWTRLKEFFGLSTGEVTSTENASDPDAD